MYEDVEQTPLSQLSQDSPETIAHAKAQGDDAAKKAAQAAAEENKWGAQEADFAKKAQALNKEERALQQKAAADLKKYKAEMKTLNETITAEKHAGVAIQEA